MAKSEKISQFRRSTSIIPFLIALSPTYLSLVFHYSSNQSPMSSLASSCFSLYLASDVLKILHFRCFNQRIALITVCHFHYKIVENPPKQILESRPPIIRRGQAPVHLGCLGCWTHSCNPFSFNRLRWRASKYFGWRTNHTPSIAHVLVDAQIHTPHFTCLDSLKILSFVGRPTRHFGIPSRHFVRFQ